jgi:hypothetical protein
MDIIAAVNILVLAFLGGCIGFVLGQYVESRGREKRSLDRTHPG